MLTEMYRKDPQLTVVLIFLVLFVLVAPVVILVHLPVNNGGAGTSPNLPGYPWPSNTTPTKTLPTSGKNNTTVTGQLYWKNVPSKSTPQPRTQAATAYDAADGYVVMFSGQNHGSTGPSYWNQTWIWKNDSWALLHPWPAPPPRRGAMMTYDYADGYVVMYGGSNDTGYFHDTWEFKAGKWTQLSEKSYPSGRRSAGIAYDASAGYVLLFGGHAGATINANGLYTILNDTWEFKGGVWKNITSQSRFVPPESTEPYMAFDPVDKYVLLFGGYNNFYPHHGLGVENTINWTYTFVNGTWTNVSSKLKAVPGYRDGGDLVYDPVLGTMFLFGGDYLTPPVTDTWTWVHGSWTLYNRTGEPPDRGANHGAYDPIVGGIVTFGAPTNQTTGVVTGNPSTWVSVVP